MGPQKKQRKMLLRDGTTKGTKKTKDTKKMLLRVGTTKETKKKKRHKKMLLGGGTTKKTKQSGCVGVLNALARIATKAPKLKKTSFAGKKERPKEAPFYTRKTRFLNKGLEGKAGGGFKKKLQIDAA